MTTVMVYGVIAWMVVGLACCVDWKATWRNVKADWRADWRDVVAAFNYDPPREDS